MNYKAGRFVSSPKRPVKKVLAYLLSALHTQAYMAVHVSNTHKGLSNVCSRQQLFLSGKYLRGLVDPDVAHECSPLVHKIVLITYGLDSRVKPLKCYLWYDFGCVDRR